MHEGLGQRDCNENTRPPADAVVPRTPPRLSRRQRFTAGVLGRLGAAWLGTLRIDTLDLERYRRLKAENRAVILALWHSQMLFMMPLAARYRSTALISPSADGEIARSLARRLGIRIVTGDSRYSAASSLKTLSHVLRRGGDVAVTPDGPLGPARRVKPGILALARLTGCPILPLGAAARAVRVPNTWDGYQIPLPWARVVAAAAEPLWVPHGHSDTELRGLGRRLEKAIDEETLRAASAL